MNITKMELNKSFGDKNIRVDDYSFGMRVGFELEGNVKPGSELTLESGCEHFDVPIRSDGIKIETVTQNLTNGGEIKIDVPTDAYQKPNAFVGGNRDPTCDFEFVTRPVSQKEMGLVKEGFDWIIEQGGDMYGDGKCGLHMTYVMNNHKKHSKFKKVVVQNFVQIVRCFYEEIVFGVCAGTDRYTRGLHFRSIPYLRHKENLSQGKPVAVCPRWREDENGERVIWGVEVRMPDGTNDWDKVIKMDKFFRAMWRYSARISRIGLIDFPQDTWDKQRNFYQDNEDGIRTGVRRKQIRVPRSNPRFKQLCELMKYDLKYFGWDFSAPSTAEEQKYEKAIELKLNGKTSKEIAIELGYSANSAARIQTLLEMGGN